MAETKKLIKCYHCDNDTNTNKHFIRITRDNSVCLCEDCIGRCVEIISKDRRAKPKLVYNKAA